MDKKIGGFKKLFSVSKESFKESLKYGVVLGVANVLLAIFNSLVFASVELNYFTMLAIVLTIVSFIVAFAVVYFGLNKILKSFPKENKFYLAIYIFGANLVLFIVLGSLIASQLIIPHGVIVQLVAGGLAIIMAKTPQNPKEAKK